MCISTYHYEGVASRANVHSSVCTVVPEVYRSGTLQQPFRKSAATFPDLFFIVPELCARCTGTLREILQVPFRIFFLPFRNSARGVPELCVKSYRYRSGSFFYRSGTLQQPFRNSAATVPELCRNRSGSLRLRICT